MLSRIEPIVGQWYFNREKDQLVEVINIDSESELVDIQDLEGNLEELDFGRWYASSFELAQAPNDWTEPFDDTESDDSDHIQRM